MSAMAGGERDWSQRDSWHRGYLSGKLESWKQQRLAERAHGDAARKRLAENAY